MAKEGTAVEDAAVKRDDGERIRQAEEMKHTKLGGKIHVNDEQ